MLDRWAGTRGHSRVSRSALSDGGRGPGAGGTHRCDACDPHFGSLRAQTSLGVQPSPSRKKRLSSLHLMWTRQTVRAVSPFATPQLGATFRIREAWNS